jgi:hypothetical protein
MESQLKNPNGLHQRYVVKNIKVIPNPNFGLNLSSTRYGKRKNTTSEFLTEVKDVDKDSEYFVMRLDTGGSDMEHIKACRIGVHAYAEAIKHHLPDLAKELIERYPLIP